MHNSSIGKAIFPSVSRGWRYAFWLPLTLFFFFLFSFSFYITLLSCLVTIKWYKSLQLWRNNNYPHPTFQQFLVNRLILHLKVYITSIYDCGETEIESLQNPLMKILCKDVFVCLFLFLIIFLFFIWKIIIMFYKHWYVQLPYSQLSILYSFSQG